MPLIDVTCAEHLCPTLDADKDEVGWAIKCLVKALPEMIYFHGLELGLDADTEKTDVLVDLHSFHPLAQNAPSLWLKITLTEAHPKREWFKIRDNLGEILQQWFRESDKDFPRTTGVDILPAGVGFRLNSHGEIIRSW